MTSSSKLFELAQLAEASYANFINKDNISRDLLLGDDGESLLSASQAKELDSNWRVVTQQQDTTSGFSATLFQRKDDDQISGYHAGDYVYAIRGTMGFVDDLVGADGGDIVIDGLALDQIVDLYNDWQRINAGQDHTYQAAKLVTLTTETALRASMAGSPSLVAYDALMALKGYIIDSPSGNVRKVEFDSSDLVFGSNDPRPKGDVNLNGALVDVTGHSLGGHLSAAFTRLFGGNAEALTVNGAGYATGFLPGLGLHAGSNIANLFEKLNGSAQFDPNAINNLYADANPEFITMDSELGLVQQGHTNGVFVEQSQPWQQTFGHGSGQMTDSLAVYDLFIRLDSGLQVGTPGPVLEKLKPLFEAASNDTLSSLENLVNALADLFDTGVKITDDAIDNREALYQAINAIKDSGAYQSVNGLTDVVLINDAGTSQCVEKAKQTDSEGIAYRYALMHLNPFVVVDADYSSHNASGELDLYDPKTGQGQLTDQWLNDRAQLLSHLLQRNLDDILVANSLAADQIFENYALPGVLEGTHLILTGPETLGDGSRKIVFGDNNANIDITGGNKSDHLYGGGGDDLLTGGKGNDYLEGGLDSDIYAFIVGDGMDTLLDTDGQGKITLDGIQAKGKTGIDPNQWMQAGNTWNDLQHNIGYSMVVHVDGTHDLLIVTASNTLIVKSWSEGKLGISLGPANPPATPDGLAIVGDLKPLDQDLNTDGIQLGYDALGNVIVGSEADPGREDTLYDDIGNDRLEGYAGSDILLANRGGDNLLYADQQQDFQTLYNQGQTAVGRGLRGDLLASGGGNDQLFGGNGQDVLAGGDGGDVLVGGGDDDLLYGDSGIASASGAWSVTSIAELDEDGAAHHHRQLNGAVVQASALGGNDILYGGSGNDLLVGGQGNDVLDGGAGRDILQGGLGNDVLYADEQNAEAEFGPVPADRLGDFLSGGVGDDLLIGGGRSDALTGGEGSDWLEGGAGNDIIFADADYTTSVNDWTFAKTDLTYPFADATRPNLNGVGLSPVNGSLDTGQGGDDIVYGGDGGDWVMGGRGDDVIYGENGMDALDGGAGNDTVYGGADDDALEGDLNADIELHGNDYLDLGAGQVRQFARGGGGADTIMGGDTADTIEGDAMIIGQAADYHGDDTINAKGGNDDVWGEGGADTVYGGDGDDYLEGDAVGIAAQYQGNDRLYGEAGDDTLIGDGGDDILNGGEGDDYLDGGDGDDTYFINAGDGIDVIVDPQRDSKIVFGAGIEADAIVLRLGSLMLDLGDGNAVHIEGFDANDALNGSAVSQFQFADGRVLTSAQLLARGFDIDGTAQNDTLSGTNTTDRMRGFAGNDVLKGNAGNDSLDGGDGNDTLSGGAGDDILIGGAGDDLLLGGEGDDEYRLSAVSGNDRIADIAGANLIRFAGDLNAANLSVKQATIAGNAALVFYVDQAETATITQGAAGFNFAFADGRRLDLNQLLLDYRAEALNTEGSDGNDILYGGREADTLAGNGGNDHLWGGAGDDLLAGGDGDDDYHYRLGDGRDLIRETQSDPNAPSQDRVVFGAEIQYDDVHFQHRANGDLTVSVGAVADAITVEGWYDAEQQRVERFVFADGRIVGADSLVDLSLEAQYGTDGNDELTGSDYRDILDGGAGDDVLNGEGGDDELRGGTGVDRYRLAVNGGADRVIDVAGDTSIIDVRGYDLTRLTASRVGDDLWLGVTGADDGLMLKDFYVMAHEWRVEDYSGRNVALSELLADNESYRASRGELETIAGDFVAGVHDGIVKAYQALGMTQLADGQWLATSVPAVTVNKLTEINTRSTNYLTNIPPNREYIAASTSPGLVWGGIESASYSSDDASIDYWRDSGGYPLKNVWVQWQAPRNSTEWVQHSVEYRHYLYTYQEALALVEAHIGNMAINLSQYVSSKVLTYFTKTTTFSISAVAVAIADADGSGVNGADVANFYNLGALPTKLSLAVQDGSAEISTLNGGDGDNDIRFDGQFAVIHGGAGNDSIRADARGIFLEQRVEGRALLDGGIGDDLLVGSLGSDLLIGGAGDDFMRGEFGDDYYYFLDGDTGTDLVYDASYGGMLEHDTIMFGEGIDVADLSFSWGSETLPVYRYGSYDETMLRLLQTLDIAWRPGAVARIVMSEPYLAGDDGSRPWEHASVDALVFADGTRLTMAEVLNLAGTPPENAPVLNVQPRDLVVTEDIGFSYTFAADTFLDFDVGDSLTFSCSTYWDWLSFDSATLTLSGRPQASAIGSYELLLTATDRFGVATTARFGFEVRAVRTLFGGDGNDTLIGNQYSDKIIGGKGDDRMFGWGGNDLFIVEGQNAGVDFFYGGADYDEIRGGDGDDTIRVNNFSGLSSAEKIDGGAGSNRIAGTSGNDIINLWSILVVNIAEIDGGDGDDRMIGSQGNDVMIGGKGSDELNGSGGDDVFLIQGVDTAADRFVGEEGFDTILGGSGNDVIRLQNFNGWMAEKIDGGAGVNRIEGTSGSDVINLADTEVVNIAALDGGDGNDTLTGSQGNDVIVGGKGADLLAGAGGDDVFSIAGDDADADRFQGGPGFDTILGGAGDDTIRVNNYSGLYMVEKIDGGAGINRIVGTANNDTIRLSTTELVNIALIDGGDGSDTLIGSRADDVIDGGLGDDVLTGGLGADRFRFSTRPGAGNVDLLTDFVMGTDLIELSKSAFGAFADLDTGSRLNDAEIGDHLLYDALSGRLAYDVDGAAGGENAVQIATIGKTTHPAALHGFDFIVIA